MKLPWKKKDTRLKCLRQEALKYAQSCKPRYCVSELYNFFIDNNRAIRNVDADWKSLTRGQQTLIRLAIFDADVNNGGVEQFFWNHPDGIVEIHDALVSVGETLIADHYSKVLDSLCETGESWLNLRERFKGNTNKDLEFFFESRELVDTDDFNNAYYGEWDGWGKQLQPGYADELALKVGFYLTTNLSEFISKA